jgi:hypothetical protein
MEGEVAPEEEEEEENEDEDTRSASGEDSAGDETQAKPAPHSDDNAEVSPLAAADTDVASNNYAGRRRPLHQPKMLHPECEEQSRDREICADWSLLYHA